MKEFKTDQVQSDSERAAKIAAIKKIVPTFNGEDKTDAYINAFHDGIMSTGTNEEEAEPEQEQEQQQEEPETKSVSADKSWIAEMKQQRVNLKEV